MAEDLQHDSYVYGFALSEAALPINGPGTRGRGGRRHERPDYDFGAKFQFGLDVVLDGLSRSLEP